MERGVEVTISTDAVCFVADFDEEFLQSPPKILLNPNFHPSILEEITLSKRKRGQPFFFFFFFLIFFFFFLFQIFF